MIPKNLYVSREKTTLEIGGKMAQKQCCVYYNQVYFGKVLHTSCIFYVQNMRLKTLLILAVCLMRVWYELHNGFLSVIENLVFFLDLWQDKKHLYLIRCLISTIVTHYSYQGVWSTPKANEKKLNAHFKVRSVSSWNVILKAYVLKWWIMNLDFLEEKSFPLTGDWSVDPQQVTAMLTL